MEFAKILAQLREELKNVETAIQTLERLQQNSRRRGRSGVDSDGPSQEITPSSARNAADRGPTPRKSRRRDPTAT